MRGVETDAVENKIAIVLPLSESSGCCEQVKRLSGYPYRLFYHPDTPPPPTHMTLSKIVTDLNRLFEPSTGASFGSFPAQKVTSPAEEPISHIVYSSDGDYRHPSRRLSISSDSPTSSTATLALEDDEIKSIFASNKNLDEPTPITLRFPFLPQITKESKIWKHRSRGSLSFADELNADAAPFVPKSARPDLSTPLTVQQQQLPLPPTPPIWLTFFEAGLDPLVSTQDCEQHAYALVVAQSTPWVMDDFVQLTQHFVWKGYELVQEGQDPLAEFAFHVYTSFYTAVGPDAAQNFIWHLREKVVGQFLAAWDPDHPNSITHENKPLAPDYVVSSLSLAKFVGDLFVHDLIPRTHAATCLSTLFKNLCSIEHIAAICHLVLHAGIKLWVRNPQSNDDLVQFARAFKDLAEIGVQDDMSVIDAPWPKGEVQRRVGEVLAGLNEWALCLASVGGLNLEYGEAGVQDVDCSSPVFELAFGDGVDLGYFEEEPVELYLA